MVKPTEVVIIYNPNSTGDGEKNAKQLASELDQAGFIGTIDSIETTHAGHAEEIAVSYAVSVDPVLLVSSSGDGGYHELINGTIPANNRSLSTAVLPSGNANDHYKSVASDDIVQNIITSNYKTIDALKITSTVDGLPFVRYAHSYAGIGLSPIIGKQMTKAKLNWFNEKWILIKYFFKYTHATVLVDGEKKRYSSLIFSTINQMSKVVKVSKTGSITDGKFEINAIGYRSKLEIIVLLIKSATFGLDEMGSFTSYSFSTIKKLPIQLDGEMYVLDANSAVKVESATGAIKTVL